MQHEARGLESAGERYLRALTSLDFASLESCFRPDVDFRALVPPGVREASDASGAADYVRRWFGDADSLEVLWSEVGSIADRKTIAYRVRVHEPDGWKVVEQRLYCDVGDDGLIGTLDLLCSGFLLTDSPPPRQ
jgi:hypothetical protein